jgi:IS1 family transposase/transposase-like protein
MQLTIEIPCPRCHGTSIVRNGKKRNGTQNYRCTDCGRQFIADAQRTYRGTCSWITALIKRLLVRGGGIRDTAAILKVSVNKVLQTLAASDYEIQPKKTHYDNLEIDEFWTYIGKKKNKMWLIYAYHRASGEIAAYVWGNRDMRTACALRDKLSKLGVTYDSLSMDNWDSFVTAFEGSQRFIGKRYTVGIEGNNCRLRHRVRRAFRKTCCFSKKRDNHLKAFAMTFFYINYGYV